MRRFLNQSPLTLCLVSLLFVSMGYLVYMNPEHFQIFVRVVLTGGFIVLTGLIIASYRPFTRYYHQLVNKTSKVTSIRPHVDYHEQLKQNTKRQVDALLKSQKYQAYQSQKQQNPQSPIILCPNLPEDQIQQCARLLQEKQTEIYQQQHQPLQPNNSASN